MDLEENIFFDMDTSVPLGIIVNELATNSLKHAFPVGIPENLDIEDLDNLGFQLIITLVDQLDGGFELKRNNGTEFAIRFTVREKNNQVYAPRQLVYL